MNSMLMDEPFVAVFPSLVRALGSVESAMVLQHINYRFAREGAPVATSAQQVSDETGIALRTVQRRIKWLVDEGLLTSERAGAYDATNQYEVNTNHHLLQVEETCRVETAKLSSGRDRMAVSTVLKKELEDSPSSPAVMDRFDEFWSAYPKKVSKQAARKAWDSVTKRVDAGVIIAAIPSNEALKRDPQFIPHPATWLRAGAWEDSTTATPVVSRPWPTDETIGHHFESVGAETPRDRFNAVIGLLRSRGWEHEAATYAVESSAHGDFLKGTA